MPQSFAELIPAYQLPVHPQIQFSVTLVTNLLVTFLLARRCSPGKAFDLSGGE